MKKEYDSYLDALLDDSFLLHEKIYLNDEGKYVVEGIVIETDPPPEPDPEGAPEEDSLLGIPGKLRVLSSLMTDKKKR